MGFVPRVGIRKFTGYALRSIRPESLRSTVREIFPHVHYDYVMNPEGRMDTRYADYHFPIRFQDGAFVELGANTTYERLAEPLVLSRAKNVAVPAGGYGFHEWMIRGGTDPSRRISGSANYTLGEFFNGYKHTYILGGTFRFNYRLNTSFAYTHNNINLPEGHFKTNLLSTRVDYSFSTSMFLNALVQYNNDARQWSSNVRFNIIHRPLSDFFLVYNERRDSISGDLIDRALIAKFTYMIAR
jgi:hypothetical protein